jgi:hypothetical protein
VEDRAMIMTGIYHFVLSPTANETKFVAEMQNRVFSLVQLTRTTTGFAHTLLKAAGELRGYAWVAEVNLMNETPYNFEQNVERVQKAIAKFGVLPRVESYANLTKT